MKANQSSIIIFFYPSKFNFIFNNNLFEKSKKNVTNKEVKYIKFSLNFSDQFFYYIKNPNAKNHLCHMDIKINLYTMTVSYVILKVNMLMALLLDLKTGHFGIFYTT